MTSPRSFREAFTEDPADVKDRARIVEQRDSARRWAAALENRIAETLALHTPRHYSWAVGRWVDHDGRPERTLCRRCTGVNWPCPTVAALTGGGDDARP